MPFPRIPEIRVQSSKIMKKLLALIFVAFFPTAAFALPYLTEPFLSPDRKEIVFVSGGDIWTVPAAGGVASLLVSHPATESRPMFSPDGKRLAFISTRTGAGDIYILDLETSALRRLTFDDIPDQLDAWSPDGKWIYFSSSSKDIANMSDIFRVSPDGGTPQMIVGDRYSNEFGAAPMLDNDSLFFSARGIGNNQWWRKGTSHIDQSELWLKTPDSYRKFSDRLGRKLWLNTNPGSQGAFVTYVADIGGRQNIYQRTNKGEQRQLTNFNDGRLLFMSVSYDQQEIVFERNFRIWKMRSNDSNGGAEVPIKLRGAAATPIRERISLSTNVGEMSVSPDGKKVAIVARGEVFAGSAKEGGDAVRITNTAAPETDVVWSGDSRKLVYASERSGSMELFQYDFTTETETQLTKGAVMDYSPVFSPDGKSIAFFRSGRSLMIYDVEKKQERELTKVFVDMPPIGGGGMIAWSPDSKSVAFLTASPDSRSYSNVSVVPAAGGTARAVSFLANSNAGSLAWSPDGTYLLFATSQRTEDGAIARVELTLRPPKFREDQFRDLFKQENPKEKNPPPSPSPTPTPATATAAPSASAEKPAEAKSGDIVYENIRQRLSILRPGLDIAQTTISPDGKTLLVLAAAEGQFNLYTISLDELATDRTARQLTSTAGFKSQAQFSPDSKEVYYVENGRVSIVSLERREVRPLAISMEVNTNFADEKMEIFKQGWRYLRDNFYDDKYHGADWNKVYQTYEPLVRESRNIDETRRLMNLMVGELNASHLGVNGPSGFQSTPVGKLGLRFDRAEFETNGRLKVTEVITLGPADVTKTIKIGDYLLAVDGAVIDAKTNLDELLENKVGKRVVLSMSSTPDGTIKRDVIVKPVATFAEKNLVYRQWVESNRRYVAQISGGKLGYVHIPDMGEGSLQQLYVDLDAENQAKNGVVIDVRNNNGGFVNPYIIDVLSRKGYLTMRERGLWNVPARSALGQRSLELPTVLVTNQHSLSDAEDFTEGYRTLGLGKVVGEPTAGWIIFTWGSQLFDGTTVRLPRQLVMDSAGKDMELVPRKVDIEVSRPIGESGKDSQLDAAVKVLIP